MSAIDCDWLDARIAAVKAEIVALEAAITAVASGAQMYQLDTGQTRQLVTKANLSSLRLQLADAESRLSAYDMRKCGAGFQGRPSY